jgi:hypothetical protein
MDDDSESAQRGAGPNDKEPRAVRVVEQRDDDPAFIAGLIRKNEKERARAKRQSKKKSAELRAAGLKRRVVRVSRLLVGAKLATLVAKWEREAAEVAASLGRAPRAVIPPDEFLS